MTAGGLHRHRHRGAQLAGVGFDLVAARRDRATERRHRPAQAAGRRVGEAKGPDQVGRLRWALVRVGVHLELARNPTILLNLLNNQVLNSRIP